MACTLGHHLAATTALSLGGPFPCKADFCFHACTVSPRMILAVSFHAWRCSKLLLHGHPLPACTYKLQKPSPSRFSAAMVCHFSSTFGLLTTSPLAQLQLDYNTAPYPCRQPQLEPSWQSSLLHAALARTAHLLIHHSFGLVTSSRHFCHANR